MIWKYLGEVGKRAFTPAVRITDGLQIAVASALPAVGKFLGVKMPETVGTDALSYIGAVVLVYIFIRFAWAPYSLWKEQVTENAALRLELAKPERLAIEHLVKERAKKRIKIPMILAEILVESHEVSDKSTDSDRINELSLKVHKLAAQSGFPLEFSRMVARATEYCVLHNSREENSNEENSNHGSVETIAELTRYANGEITLDQLSSRLHPYVATGKSPIFPND